MDRKNIVLYAVTAVFAAAALIFVLERVIQGMTKEPVAVHSPAPGQPGSEGIAQPQESAQSFDYEINRKTGEKQFLR
jgi:hypothetical protein